ncbi:tetratricopeptide repeat protein [Paracoccus aerodenitrificans]|uniref:tetratricopeptide repeat protein n=1 Tax=Paracoccus aerodenitrificans TaxID=3017781 RepID=UPI0022F136B9|nr:tetratricopeptide repeat protein [Paracoccus aerodenitrificans]WBU64082.1 tetratricopeptide repeat protein [Paracoccus aerodenitrificans]
MRSAPAILAGMLACIPFGALAQVSELDPGVVELNDPALIEGLEAMPSADLLPAAEDIAATVDAENEAARIQVDDQTLADMQADLRAVSADLQALRAELLASGAEGFAAAGGDTAIDRMNAMEARLAELTEQTEQLSNRISRIVADGTNRIGDIEFRLCELDQNCDLGALMTSQLGQSGAALPSSGGGAGMSASGSGISATTLPPISEPDTGATPPTEEEKREFDEARAAVDAGQWPEAILQLDHLISAHAGGPLTAEALYLRGVAQDASGQVSLAAESWLQAFSAAPDGARAPASLLALSGAMIRLGDAKDACPYFAELTTRFPGSPEAATAAEQAQQAGCADATSAEGERAE